MSHRSSRPGHTKQLFKSKTHWGAASRFGQLKVLAEDFSLIAEAMGVHSIAANAT